MDAKQLKTRISTTILRHYGVEPENAAPVMIYNALGAVVRDLMMEKWTETQEKIEKSAAKQVCYLSMEFLLGRSLRNNVFNLGLMKEVEESLAALGTDFTTICEVEHDAALGNGGLGRLAACYMDAMASQGLPATGYSILYEYGIFKQKIIDGQQTELPDSWLDSGRIWLVPRQDETEEVRFGGTIREEWREDRMHIVHENYVSVNAVPNDMLISGYQSDTVNTLRLWQAKSPYSIDMALFSEGAYLKSLEQQAMAEVISKILYPEDNHYEGKSLRVKQQYFFVSASVQSILKKEMKRFGTLDGLYDHYVIQINDTHPAMVIPELMRLMMDVYGYGWDKAWEITNKTVAYTNHTVMVEALEHWPKDLIRQVVPRIYQIIAEINERFCAELWKHFPGDWERISRMAIMSNGEIHMANLSIAGAFSVNGVSELHSQILKDDCFKNFYLVSPEKFRNVTNGITYRRWMGQCNPELTELVCSCIGDGFLRKPDELAKLMAFTEDESVLTRFAEAKRANKLRLAEYIRRENGISVDPDSLFDVQAKRLHEYKRQLLNVLHILRQYFEIKDNPNADFVPRTYLFGAKAAPGYGRAKRIIQLIHALADMVNSDPDIRGRLKVVFLEDYRVSVAEILMPAANLSEQISTAGREASGTGNMKFMLNGAITIGTMDGANVEIAREVGEENMFIFGLKTPEVNELIRQGYNAMNYYQDNAWIARILMAISTGIGAPGRTVAFPDIVNSLVMNSYGNMADPYLVLADFEDYCRAQNAADALYRDSLAWNRVGLINTAKSGIFAADRSVLEYDERIWHLTHLNELKG